MARWGIRLIALSVPMMLIAWTVNLSVWWELARGCSIALLGMGMGLVFLHTLLSARLEAAAAETASR